MNEPKELIYVGDVIEFTFVVTHADGSVVDLGAYDTVTVLFGLPRAGGEAFEGAAVLVAAGAGGVCKYTAAPGQLSVNGQWRVQVVGRVGGVPHNHSGEARFEVLATVG